MLVKVLRAWFVLAITTMVPATATEPPPIFVGGQFIRQHAIQDRRGNVLVPIRGVFEALHAAVTYTPPRFVVVRKDGAVVAGLIIGRTHALVGKVPRSLPAAPILRHGRVYAPLRTIAEIAGATVTYSANPRLVDIRLPYTVLTVNPPAGQPDPLPLDPVTPPWAYALVGAVTLALLIELYRRLAGAARSRRPRLTSRSSVVPLASRALQLPYAADARDQHGIGQMRK